MKANRIVLLTGGAGYIGSHLAVRLIESNYDVIILDSFVNSNERSIGNIAAITGTLPILVNGDIRNRSIVDRIFSEYDVSAVVHLAGLKSVSESVSDPLSYYENNVIGGINLVTAMKQAGVFRLLFSSSATIYGPNASSPVSEQYEPCQPVNPYGRSKLFLEEIYSDICASDPRWSVGVLRYFNPVGAHKSALIGEDPSGIPNNLFPFVSAVVNGNLPKLNVFGDDYDTPDGTGVRDYIHVMDLADGHLRALNWIEKRTGYDVWNLGTGTGVSVLEIIRVFERITSVEVPFQVVERRAGDIATCYADVDKSFRELGWKAQRTLFDMIEDTWRWQQKNPNGFRGL